MQQRWAEAPPGNGSAHNSTPGAGCHPSGTNIRPGTTGAACPGWQRTAIQEGLASAMRMTDVSAVESVLRQDLQGFIAP